jgi:hypothetical protein
LFSPAEGLPFFGGICEELEEEEEEETAGLYCANTDSRLFLFDLFFMKDLRDPILGKNLVFLHNFWALKYSL